MSIPNSLAKRVSQSKAIVLPIRTENDGRRKTVDSRRESGHGWKIGCGRRILRTSMGRELVRTVPGSHFTFITRFIFLAVGSCRENTACSTSFARCMIRAGKQSQRGTRGKFHSHKDILLLCLNYIFPFFSLALSK